MSVGPKVRALAGKYEPQLSRLYRRAFLDLDGLCDLLDVPSAGRVLEVGCGEGLFTEVVAAKFPTATIVGIDISPSAGRLFEGADERVSFQTVTIADFAAREPQPFDVVLISDVLHHVPVGERAALVADAIALTAAGGQFVLKEFEPVRNLMTPIAWASDAWVSGDRPSFETEAIWRELIQTATGPVDVVEGRVGPCRNNLVLSFRKEADSLSEGDSQPAGSGRP